MTGLDWGENKRLAVTVADDQFNPFTRLEDYGGRAYRLFA